MSTPNYPRAGTVEIEGLIEGPVPPFDDGAKRLAEWGAFARSSGLPLALSVEGASFSVLAGKDAALEVSPQDDIQDTIAQVVGQLVGIYPEDLRSSLSSTLRSVEYQNDKQRQTMYFISGAGVQVRDRTVAWEQKNEPPSLSFADLPFKKFRPFLIGGAVVAGIAIISLFIIDYTSIARDYGVRYGLAKPKEVDIDAEKIARYVSVKSLGLNKKKTHLRVEVSRAAEFPRTLDAFRTEESRIEASDDFAELRGLHAVALQGILRVEYRDKKGEVFAEHTVTVRRLHEVERVEVEVPLAEYKQAARIVFGF